MIKITINVMALTALLMHPVLAGESNAVSISDLKEVTYNLIVDVQKLNRSQSEGNHNLKVYIDDINSTVSKNMHNTYEKLSAMQEKMQKAVDRVNSSAEDIQKRAILIKQGDSELDKLIAVYVEKNSHLLPENVK